MNLKDYLEDLGIPLSKFARKANVSRGTIENAVKGKDISLSVALKIEGATKGQVKCKDLLPTETRENIKKSKKTTQEQCIL